MRLALLGCDSEWKTFLRDLPAGHEVVAVCEAAEHELPLCALLPAVQRSESWESLLIRDDIDLILVASPQQLPARADGFDPQANRVDQLKKLAQAGRSLLLSFPATELLDAYEIEMLRREGNGCLVPWFPGLNHPAWQELPRLPSTANASVAPLQITWERRVDHRSRNQILAALARDLILIERTVGKLKRVTALGGPADSHSADRHSPQDWHSFTVQLEAEDRSLVRWSPARPSATFACRAVVEEGANPWELQAPVNTSEPWLLRERDSNEDSTAGSGWSDIEATLANFARIHASPTATANAWVDACRILEIRAAVEKSVQRSRTIELSQAEQTEEYQFKGVMASTGCLMLMLVLFAVFVVALVEGFQLPLRNSAVWRLWPIGLVISLAIFLGLQFLQAVIQKPRNSQTGRDFAG
ncbi:hypothetical protein [Anatilimnocola floriformis]|uniref:hypothetical protein n=1 Tax=Anatilimnocola floriformis TaxID=2948575 RepID=UPI0020C261B7|nr:hypothetical protein [Anatilimnocola floriformis]